MISVIVSIYKVENYLDKCIRSILQQDYEDFELILIDDGSHDRCPEICDEWEKKEKKIRVIHKPNGGLSSARNCGIDHALGKWIVFPDPDDWCEPNYLRRLISIKEMYNADISICGHYYNEDRVFNSEGKIHVLETEEALEMLMLPDSFKGYAWNKLYDMDVIKEHNLRFDEELGMVQDLHFNVRYFQYCKTIAYDPFPVYHYMLHDEAVTSARSPLTPRKISGVLAYKKIAALLKDKYPKLEAIAYSSLCRMCLDDIIIYYRSRMRSKEILNSLWQDFKKYRKYFYCSEAYSSKYKRCSRFAVIHPKLYYYTRRIYWHIDHAMLKREAKLGGIQ